MSAPSAADLSRRRAPRQENDDAANRVREFKVVGHVGLREPSATFPVLGTLWSDVRMAVSSWYGVEPQSSRLAWKLSSESKKNMKALESDLDFTNAVVSVTDKMQRAKTAKYWLDVYDLNWLDADKNKSGKSGQKRRRQDDVPNVEFPSETQAACYKKLVKKWACEQHRGWCFIRRNGEHDALNFKILSLWAEQMSEGVADEWRPPEMKAFDHVPKRAKVSHGSVPAINIVLPHGSFTVDTTQPQDGGCTSTMGAASTPQPSTSTSTAMLDAASVSATAGPSSIPTASQPVGATLSPEYPCVEDLLDMLERRKPGSGYMTMLDQLHLYGLMTADDISRCNRETLQSMVDLPGEWCSDLYKLAVDVAGDWHRIRTVEPKGSTPMQTGVGSISYAESDSEYDELDESGSESEDGTGSDEVVAAHRDY
ncbi:hypothetical protein PUNSTDRAFT_146426 [Punctularia strigosozonata HHB-11173 SS5]|uniref:Uncharacterized protein n=1 Tax=Punctularia strigosozonata (strain HHB-11173) TaxID=741275 RepID=R7S3K2_PUNST|nr:uncharacterized protein PUNSTDRAFT_146426 [Punctularia strigosozonata HHB-11173 SS5]EIN04444.1 hypothetical protein PUNSTDRAFT_146426 [Punctularia strigosozonata HHB-11173 SS5]